MKTYIVGKNNLTVQAGGFLSAYMLTCNWFNPKTAVPVTDCESNETCYLSRTLDRSGRLARICEHTGPQGKILAIY